MKVLQYTAMLTVVLGCLEAALPPENPMPGGWFDIADAANDEKVQQMADFAANQMGYTVVTINAAQSAVSRFYYNRCHTPLPPSPTHYHHDHHHPHHRHHHSFP